MDVHYNDVYGHILQTDARVIVNYGGRDSGKSYFVGGQYVPLMMASEKYFRGVAIRKTYASLKDSVYREVLDGISTMELDSQFSTIKSPLEIEHVNGNKLLFRGMDNPTKIKSLKGINFIWYEEAEDLTYREFMDLLIILRGEGYQRLVMTFNPIDEDHFSNHMFVENKADEVLETFPDGDKKVWHKYIDVSLSQKEKVRIKALVIRSTFDDNAFIPSTRKAVIEALKENDPFLYNVYAKGLFGTKGGRILTNIEQIDFEERGWKFENFDARGYGIDWGFNHASAVLWTAEHEDCLLVFQEIYEFEKDTDEIEQIMARRGVDKRTLIISESAEPDRIKTLRKRGYKVKEVEKYGGSVNDQIDKLKRYRKIYINTTCVNTWKEAKAYRWKEDKHGKFTDEPVNVFDDAMAALRYATDLYSRKKKIKSIDKSKFGF